MKTRFCGKSAGTEKCLRYQPTPAGRKPPAPPVGFFGSKGPSMLQSCGTSNFRQLESSHPQTSAPTASPLKNRQSASKDLIIRVCAVDELCEHSTRTNAAISAKN